MSRTSFWSIGFILGVALANGPGCGRSSTFSVFDGNVGDTAHQSTGVTDSGDGGTSDGPGRSETDARVDATNGPKADAQTDADAQIDAGRPDGGRAPYHAIAVASGEYHNCAILDDHRVKCWGNNDTGQLGLGDTIVRGADPSTMGDNLPTVDLGTGRTAKAIAASRYTSCAILDDQTVKCWGGAGGCPLLGRGPPLASGPLLGNVGAGPEEMGDHLPALDFGGRRTVNVAMGEYAACASMDDNTIWCWGGCGAGDIQTPQLRSGLPTRPVKALGPGNGGVVALYEDGTLSPELPGGDPVLALPSGRKAVAVAGGVGEGAVTCALLDDATTVCSEYSTQPANAIAIGVMRIGGLCSAFSDGSVKCDPFQFCTQSNPCPFALGACPQGYPCSSDGSYLLGSAAQVVTSNGNDFACALLADGSVKCWDDSGPGPYPVLGSGVIVSAQGDAGITYGAWHPVDLGTHP
jgi:hypothetical protein